MAALNRAGRCRVRPRAATVGSRRAPRLRLVGPPSDSSSAKRVLLFFLQDQAEAFIAGVKADARCWELCCDKFTRTDHVEVRFWCAKTLFEVSRVNLTRAQAPRAPEPAVQALRLSCLQLATVHWRSMPGNVQRIVQQVSWSWVGFCATADPPVPPFVANKVAQLVAFVAGYEYPARWPEFFDDLLGKWRTSGCTQVPALPWRGPSRSRSCTPLAGLAAGGPSQVLAFCRVMKALDSDIISLDIPRSQEESRRSMEFKDAMREACIGRVSRVSCVATNCATARAEGRMSVTFHFLWLHLTAVAGTCCR